MSMITTNSRFSLDGPTNGQTRVEYPARKWEFFTPIVNEWWAAGDRSRRSPQRKRYDEIAEQCYNFFAGSLDFMWDQNFVNRYMGGESPGKHYKIVLNKVFELVAVFGPACFYQNPRRAVEPYRQLELNPEWLTGGSQDPQAQAFAQVLMQMEGQRRQSFDIQAALMDFYLNYTPDEQGMGGLARNAMLAITELMVMGRGIMWPKASRKPGSDQLLTGSYWAPQDGLLSDPDAERLDDAWWYMKEEQLPYWKLEDEFRLPRNSLRQYAQFESTNGRVAREANGVLNVHKQAGQTNDTIRIRRVWSKMGVGGRLRGVDRTAMSAAFDEVVGDHCYLVIAEGIPWPLNAPRSYIENENDDQIRARFRWPVETWRDGKKPFTEFRFYDDPNSQYPLPAIFAGLGELVYLNCFISQLAGKAAASSRTLIAVANAAAKEVKPKLESAGFFEVFEVGEITEKIDNWIKVIEFNSVNSDAWQIIDLITQSFERATGLSEMAYGINSGGQDRSATGSKIRNDAVQVRPEYMRGRVQEGMREVADLEKLLVRFRADEIGKTIATVMGPAGSYLWNQHVAGTPPEQIVHQMRMTVVPEDLKRPNRDKDLEAIGGVVSTIFPALHEHGSITGDTSAENAFIRKWLKAANMEEHSEELMMGPRQQQPPSPEEQQMQQQAAELEMRKLSADTQQSELAVHKAQSDVQAAQVKNQADMQRAQGELQVKQGELAIKQQELGLKAQTLQNDQQKGGLEVEKLGLDIIKARLDIQKAEADVQGEIIDVQGNIQQQQLEEERHDFDMQLADRQQDLAEYQAKQQAAAAKQQARQSQGSNNG